MIPIWLYAGYRVRKDLRSKQVPLLALSAAFTFVIMMFNIPIPGGSTGHAVGGAIIGIILGPWAAIVSISVALIIQAFVFGDGGITAIGANCFNMAVVMPIVGYYAYRLISGRSDIKSPRRIAAAVIAGYLSLVIASGFAGFEFGIQPLLYPAVDGKFQYMPYDLSVTLPAMLIEHMLFFGVLEALITGLVFLYFQRNAPDMLEIKKRGQKIQNKMAAEVT
jgi:cobalt/nickel transport system permease protein